MTYRSRRGSTPFQSTELEYSSSTRKFSASFDTTPVNAFDPIPGRTASRASRGKQEVDGWSQPAIPSRMGNFDLLTEFKLGFADIKVAKWQSRVTGLKVVWAQADGPIINGHFQVNTEIFNDSGCAHTLEHLTFCGSERYPFNGALDKIGNRLLGNGTNAWTMGTNTTYTCATACQEWFLGLLPVTLSPTSFTTEVYHMDGKGEDGGVVFSEMQGSATSISDLMPLKMQRSLYNKKNGNRSETGGLLPNLRKLELGEISEYHSRMYQPQNVTVMVIGSAMDPARLLRTLQDEVEPSLVAHHLDAGARPPGWRRPFVESRTASNPQSIPESSRSDVLYPSKDESVGSIVISWIGPRAQDYMQCAALTALASYLSDSAVSPLSKIFMDVPEPACGAIEFNADGDPRILSFELDGVPARKLDALPEQFLDALAKIASSRLDMLRMVYSIEKMRLGVLESVETDPASYLYDGFIDDGLYGPEDGSNLSAAFDDLSVCRALSRWTSEQWAELLEHHFVNQKCLILVAKPSAAMADDVAREDKARVAANVVKLGKTGLAALGTKLKSAVKKNARPVPGNILPQFAVPDLSGINWISTVYARSNGIARELSPARNAVQEHVDRDGPGLPLFVEFAQIRSAFVTISITLSPADLPHLLDAHLKSLIPLYIDTFAALPTNLSDGRKLSYEETVKELNKDTISCSMGVDGETFVVSINVVKESYGIAVTWLRDLLWGSTFSVDRLKNSLVQALASLPNEKQDGSGVAAQAFAKMIKIRDSNSVASNVFTRAKSVPAILAQLKQEPEVVVEELEALRRAITDLKAMRVLVVGDILSLNQPSTTWSTNSEPLKPFTREQLISIPSELATISPLSHKLLVTLLPSIESSFAQFGAIGPSSWDDPDLPALTIARGTLNADEGFLWNAVRGAGLPYDASIGSDVASGLMVFVIFKSPDAFAAWDASRKLIEDILSGKNPITDLDLEAAKSTLAFSVANGQSNEAKAATASFTNTVILGRPRNYHRLSLERANDVTLPEVLRAIRKYIKPLFDPSRSIGSVTCGPGKDSELVADFKGAGYDVSSQTFA